MTGKEFYDIRKRLGLSRDQFAIELGYRGNAENNDVLLRRYERGAKQIPLTVATCAWLIFDYYDTHGRLPEYPDWQGYDQELAPGRGNDRVE